jgi:beta-lactamase regulating signal transducer with metallopeptidase domain/HEAT repeat protein
VDTQALILVLAKATLLLLAGGALAFALRRAPSGARHLVWLATLAGVLALPALVRLTPLSLPVLPAPPAALRELSARVPDWEAPPAAATRVGQVGEARPADAIATSAPTMSWATLALGLWLGGAMLLLARQAVGLLAVRRLVARSAEVTDPAWNGLLCDVADRLDLAALPRLRASGEAGTAFACGLLRPTIVLPAAAESWEPARREQVLVHELAHVRRRDPAAHALAHLACAAYWFHPLVWVAARRLRAESERACDDLVLACGAKASDYAGFLLDVLAARRHAPASAVCMARPRELEGRVLAILDPALRRGRPGRLQTGALVAGLGGALTLVVVSAPVSPVAAQGSPAPQAAPEAVEAPRAAEPEDGEDMAPALAPVARKGRTAPSAVPASDRSALLVQVLRKDPDASVRRSAAWALAETEGDPAVLIAALRGDEDAEVREMAAWALADAEHADAEPALAHALRTDKSAEVRRTAAWALGQEVRRDLSALHGAVADRDPEVRQAAIWALGQHDLRKAPESIVKALRDSDAEVRMTAGWALGEIQDPAAVPALEAAYASEQDEEARQAIFRALAIGDPSADFIDRALASPDPEIRAWAVRLAAGRAGSWPWPWPWPDPRPNP